MIRLSDTLTKEQIAYADKLLASWGCRTWPEGKCFSVYHNDHVPIVKLAMKKALHNKPNFKGRAILLAHNPRG